MKKSTTEKKKNIYYVVWYIHTDKAEYSEIIGVFHDKKEAVKELIIRSNYREKDGKLTQYMQPTDEYNSSYNELFNKVMDTMELKDLDIYRITKVISNE